ncbi:BON domain-containing protein [Burkholderia metallica]|uniref:BON domain-containing protein n=1 Tax=Burkholderia metallica TaxID=488729 RepID=UPI0008422540|nr:BON domain-containing protein [Burkholderia metallica]AOJ34987.1 transporter [Burkholderia metallica]
MNATERTQYGDTRGRPSGPARMPSVVSAALIAVLSCAWVATPRDVSAEEGVGAKLEHQASAVGGQIRDAALVAERGLASDDIDVQVHQRVAELTGSVPDERQRATAIRVAHDIDGVSGVRDRLQIRRK